MHLIIYRVCYESTKIGVLIVIAINKNSCVMMLMVCFRVAEVMICISSSTEYVMKVLKLVF